MIKLFATALAVLLPCTAQVTIAQPAGARTDTLPRDPVAYHALLLRARALLSAQRHDAAESAFDSLTSQYPLDHETWIGLATARRRQRKHQPAIDAYQRAITIGGPWPGSARYWTAVAHAALGDTARTLQVIRQLVHEDHELNRPGLAADPAFASLTSDPRFLQLVAPVPARDANRVAGWRSDVDHLLAEITRLSPDHRGKPLPAATAALATQLKAHIPSLDDAQVYAGLSRIIASLHQGHTMMWGAGPPGSSAPSRMVFTYLPLQLHAFPEGLFVIAARDGARDLVGARLVSIGSVTADSAYALVAGATSFGSATEALWTVPQRMSDVMLLQGLGAVRGGTTVSARFQLPSGSVVERSITPVAEPVRTKLPAPPGVTSAAFTSRIGESHWAQPMRDGRTMYVQFNQVFDDPDETLAAFGLRLRRELASSQVQQVIVDLRHNNGGNTFTYRELLRTLVAFSAAEGHQLHVLIGRGVYSAAANFSTDLERLANAVFIGEPTSMTGNQHGDEGRVQLPWSGLQATVSGVKWQLSHPWDQRTSIVPEVPVALTARAYFAGQDPVLEAALRLADAPAP